MLAASPLGYPPVEILALLQRLGSDGGRELEWKGKLGLIFACTNVIDTHYSVENALGNRFLLSRSEPNRDQFKWALKHTGTSFAIMRRELADSVNALFALPRPDPQPLDPEGDEFKRLDRIASLVVRLRGAVERDRYKRDIQAFHGAEGPGRIGLALERLLAGPRYTRGQSADCARRRRGRRAR